MRRVIVLSGILTALLALGLSGHDPLWPPPAANAEDPCVVLSAGPPTVTRCRWGPFQVPTNPPLFNGVVPVPMPCTDCYITQVVPNLVFWSGVSGDPATTANFINKVQLHHLVIVDSAGADRTCPSLPRRFFASGNERRPLTLPAGYGYYVAPASAWTVQVHLHNYDTVPKINVWLELTFTHRPGTDPLKNVTPVWLDIDNCGDSEYQTDINYVDTHTETAPGSDPNIAQDWIVPPSFGEARIVAMGGHVHDYGISVSAFNSRTSSYMCTSIAGYGSGSRYYPPAPAGPGGAGHPQAANAQTLSPDYHEPGASPDNRYHIQDMTDCNAMASTLALNPSDVIKLHAQYNNAQGFPITDAMGIMVAYTADNCPGISNPDQTDTDNDTEGNACDPGDFDLDGFSDRVEYFVGTDPAAECATSSSHNAWPADLNNDTFSDGTDLIAIAGSFGQSVAPAPPRRNVAPDPPDGFVDGTDLIRVANFFGLQC